MYSKIVVLLTCLAITGADLVPTGYNFGYDIQGPGDGQSRQETGDANGNVVGSYSIKDADGRQRKVSYVADALGFRANIDTNEPGTAAKSSANVLVNGATEEALPVVQTSILGLSSSGYDLPAKKSDNLVPTGYKFGYDIQGPLDSQGREESGDANGNVAGSYSIKDADGRKRKVDYVADAGGFRATINTNEPGTAAQSPADVQLNSPYPAPVSVEPLPVPVQLPVKTEYAPLAHVTFSTPLFFSRQLISSPSKFLSQQHLTAPLISAPLYTSRTYSSTTYGKTTTPVYQHVQLVHNPIVQEVLPLKTFVPASAGYKSTVHSSTTYAKKHIPVVAPLPVKQYVQYITAPAPLPIALPTPVYTSITHSSTSYGKKLPALVQEPLPVKAAISSGYISKTHSSTSYEKKVEHVVQSTSEKPLYQEQLPAKPLSVKGQSIEVFEQQIDLSTEMPDSQQTLADEPKPAGATKISSF